MSAEEVRGFLLWLHFGLLGGWAGGIFLMFFAAGPALDHSMVSKALCAQVQGRMFRRFNLAALSACFFLFGTLYSFSYFVPEKSAVLWKLFFGTAAMGLFTAYSLWGLLPRLELLKEGIPALPLESQGQREYDRLLRVYRGLQGLTGLLGLFILYGSVVTF